MGWRAPPRRPSACSRAAGYGWIVVETVGVGQVEVEIAGAADTTVVVVNPGWGDGVQAAKAGLLEIGDVFAVNKADRAGLAATVHDLRAMLQPGRRAPWIAAGARDRRHRATAASTRSSPRWRDHRAASRRFGRRFDRRRERRIADEVRALVLDQFDQARR